MQTAKKTRCFTERRCCLGAERMFSRQFFRFLLTISLKYVTIYKTAIHTVIGSDFKHFTGGKEYDLPILRTR